MLRKILLTIFFLVITILFIWFGFGVVTKDSSEQQLLPTQLPYSGDIDFSQPTPAPINQAQSKPQLKQTGWIPDWAMADGMASLQTSAQYFDSISPVWYYLNEEGLITTKHSDRDELTTFCNQQGIKLIPSIADFNADTFHLILDDDQLLQAHINYLISEVETYDYDGLDLDYESIYLEDQAEYLFLVRSLYEYLDPLGKTLSIAVMPTWTDADVFTTLRQTRQVQDWHELGLYVHELRIMTYNVTNYNSTYPGPIAPLDWQAATLRHARIKVDPEKTFLGLSQYGYDGWSNNPQIAQPYLSMLANTSEPKGQADAVTYEQVAARGNTSQASLKSDSLEKLLTYQYEDTAYLIYFPDSETTHYRVQLAQQFGIGGIAHWRLGDEDLGSYTRVNN